MPSQRYYRERARTLFAWSKATQDKAYAAQLRLRAANELEQAQQARTAVADLNVLPSELHAQRRKTRAALSLSFAIGWPALCRFQSEVPDAPLAIGGMTGMVL